VTELRRNEELKDEFLSIASHELRTPISAAKSYVELARHAMDTQGLGPPGAEAAAGHVQAIDHQLDRISRMVDELLDVTRLDHGGLPLRQRLRSIDDAIAIAVRNVRPFAQQRPVHLAFAPHEGRPQASLDEARIEQVLANVLSNAAQHSEPASPIEIQVSIEEQPLGKRMAVVRVQDHGTGIDPANAERIFDRYFTVEQARTPEEGRPRRRGLGLGLYISRRIIQQHGGSIWAESQPGHGTTVVFTLPLTAGE
jgi:signal transduction histidine kinase